MSNEYSQFCCYSIRIFYILCQLKQESEEIIKFYSQCTIIEEITSIPHFVDEYMEAPALYRSNEGGLLPNQFPSYMIETWKFKQVVSSTETEYSFILVYLSFYTNALVQNKRHCSKYLKTRKWYIRRVDKKSSEWLGLLR